MHEGYAILVRVRNRETVVGDRLFSAQPTDIIGQSLRVNPTHGGSNEIPSTTRKSLFAI